MKKVIAISLLAALSLGCPPAEARQRAPLAMPDAASVQKAKPFKPLTPQRPKMGLKGQAGLSSAPAALTRKSGAKRMAKAAATTLSDGLELRGSVVSTWSFMRFPGYYNIPTTDDGEFVQLGGVIAEYGAWDDGRGRMYVAGIEDWGMGFVVPYLTVYDTESWEEVDVVDAADYTILATDNAEDPTTGDVYGCFYDEDYENLTWAKADYPAGVSHAIRTLSEDERLFGVACDASGQYYGVTAKGDFVKVDKATGEFTTVGSTGLRPYYVTSAAFDDKSNSVIFSYAPASGNSSLWSIDPATGAATLLADYVDNDQITALTVVKPAAEPLAPAAPLLEATAPGGGKTIHYTLTLPSTHFDGSDAAGSLKWCVTIDGEEVGAGTSAAGSTVDGEHAVADDGAHTVAAYAENEVGRSPMVKVTVVIGAGVPKAPANLGINNFGGGEVSLYWDAVTGSVDGAYVDPDAITYTVSRNGEVVAEGLTDTWFDERVDVPDTYLKLNYEVRAVYADNASEPSAVSTGVGAITPPYACSFSTKPLDHELYTSVNANGDDVEWYFSEYYACFKYDYGSNAADDWLISPAFALEAGKTYELTYSIAPGHTTYTERYALAMGVAPTAAAMVTELLPATELSGDLSTPTVKTIAIKPATTGNYYIGWHALSDASMFMIQVKDISLSAGMTGASPSEVTDISLIRDKAGYLNLNGSFKAPATDISGNALTAISKITVVRQGLDEPVATFASPKPGETLSFEDRNLPEMGTYTYEFNVWGADGNIGRVTKASAYVGPTAPADVLDVRLVEDPSAPGYAILSWDAPLYDVEGNELQEQNLTYMVYVAGQYNQAIGLLDEPTADRQLRVKVCEPTEKAFATFYVSAFNLGLESAGLTRSPMVPVGASEPLPYAHSFNADDRGNHLLGYIVTPESGSYVEVGNKDSENVAAQDGDDAFLKIFCGVQGNTTDFFTGKISLAGAANPALSLYYYKWADSDRNLTDVSVVDADGKEYPLASIDNSTTGNVGWNLIVCPLDVVKGKVVNIMVHSTALSHNIAYYDNLRVIDRQPVDLAAVALNAPERVEAEKPFALTATVANFGTTAAENYTVELLLNGKVVATADNAPALAPGQQTSISFSYTLTPVDAENSEMTVRVTLQGDRDASNDVSPAVAPQVVVSKYPAVSDLKAERSQSGVDLSWSAPSTEGFDAKEVEDFEDATAWTEEVEGWTMIDRDAKQIGTLEGASLPDAVAMRTTHSFFVFDNESDDAYFYNPDLAYLVKGNSGSKSLVAMYILPMDAEQDDWAISPLLSGEAQTISFYARSFHPEYLDMMEVLYSMTDSTDPDDFVSLCPEGSIEVPQLTDAIGNAAYKEYTFSLPEGARRFAIRANNQGGNGFMLMIDDVKFRQANATLEVAGYDIYRDGVKINDAPLASPSYIDTEADGGSHTYHVVVRYNRGLSPASNGAGILSGIDGAMAGGAKVTVVNRTITVEGVASDTKVSLYGVDGKEVGTAAGSCRFNVAPGTYLLSAGQLRTKVFVK